jgi:hypothetical protein
MFQNWQVQMKSQNPREISIYLDDISNLFLAPDFNPYAKKPNYISGLQVASNEIKMASRRASHRLILYLPEEKITPDLLEITRRAIDNYCDFKLEETHREVLLLRWEGFEALQIGVIFMASCLFISLYIREIQEIPEYLRSFISEGLSIVGWVSMWKPIDILLYQWWPHWQSRFIYEKLRVAGLEIRPR